MKKVNLKDKYADHVLPQDLNIQTEILSACLNNQTPLVLDYLTNDEVFYGKEHFSLFKAIKTSYLESGKVSVLNILRSSKDSHISSLASKLKELYFNEKEIVSNCLRLIELYIARETIKICSDTVDVMYSNSALALETSLKLVDLQKNLTDAILLTKKESFVELRDRVIQEVCSRVDNLEDSVISTGVYDIDSEIGGFEIGSVNIIGARPGMGKTAFTIQLIYNVGFLRSKPVLAFNLEMTKEELVKRLLALHTKSGNFEIRSGFFGDKDRFEKFKKDAETFVTDNIYLIDDIYEVDDITRLVMSFKDKHDIQLCIIDYVQLVGANGGYREQEISKISRQFKICAKSNKVPLIALAQLNRAVESRAGGKPVISDLRESGSIEQDADSVIMLYRPEKYGIKEDELGNSTVGLLQLLVQKYRNGMADIEIPVMYEPRYNKIETINKKPTQVPSKPISLGVQSSIDSFESEVRFGNSDENSF